MSRKPTKVKKRKRKSSKITTADVATRVQAIAKADGREEKDVLEDMFGDGWLTIEIEESGAVNIDASQLYSEDKKITSTKRPSECQRLRDTFAPVASCVKYVRDQILASGIDAVINDPTDKHQLDVKEKLEMFIENIHQDRYTRGLYTLLSIMVDIALTTGISAAEICYNKTDLDFWDYASVESEPEQIQVVKGKKDFKTISYDLIKTQDPDWSKLGGIVRLKIAQNALTRFKLYRILKTWQANYWTIDEMLQKDKEALTTQGLRINLKSFQKEKPQASYLHPWQVFWLPLNRKSFSEIGEGIIVEVLTSALLLEKVLKAVGEGIHRAGNKRYFIVCGTDKRPWSGRYIRNMLQQMKEASNRNWSTIPAPSGFDIKSIGGEVFEAHNVVTYFKRMIARGLGCPASVLGVGDVKDEPAFSYAILREQVKIAIKYQLFEPHLWCLFGVKELKKQGGSPKPMYIPNPRFRLEDLFGFEKRLDMILKPFNVANPFFGQTKLQAEREYCMLMGWDTVLLPTQKEYIDELKEAEELDKLKRELEIKQLKYAITQVGKEPEQDDETDELDENGKPKEKETEPDKKKQGDPKPQTKERQKKRLEGMKKMGKGERGQSKKMGDTRKPVEETVPANEPQKLEITLVTKSDEEKLTRTIVTPTDEIMTELANERINLAKKQNELTDLKKKFAEADNERKQAKIQKEMDKLNTDIEGKNLEIKNLKAKIEKVKVETEEIQKTHEEKRKIMEKIQEQVEKEERLTNKVKSGGDV